MLKGEIFIKIVSGNFYLSMTTPYSFLNSKKFLNSYFTLFYECSLGYFTHLFVTF